MRRWSMLLGLPLVITLVVVGGFGPGCGGSSDNPTISGPQPPELPPQSTFIMDFDDFDVSAGIARMEQPLLAQAGTYWGHAAFRVLVWDVIIGIGMAVPSAAFVEAFQHTPVQQADSSWDWTYSITSGVQHTCRLNGKVNGSEVQWHMYLTKDGFFEDYPWYSGSHDLALTEGSWILNRDPELPNPFLSIEWHRDPATNTGDLKYTNIIPGDAENGGYIFYGSTTGGTYDRFYDIYNKGLENLTEIEWNHPVGNGRIKDPNLFGNSSWHCWDGTLENVICP
ncbi:MAG: hypothetical protein ABIE70_13820 [bacterium]